jgi:hypothetical protein
VTAAPGSAGFVTTTYHVQDTRSTGETFLVTSVAPFDYDWSSAAALAFLTSNGTCPESLTVSASVSDGRCGLTSPNTTPIPFTVAGCPSPFPFIQPAATSRTQAPLPSSGWISQLEVPSGRGQVVVNGSSVFFPPSGRAPVAGKVKAGENRVEATLVQAAGQPGLWRFELGGERAMTPGSLRVIAGPVAVITGDTVVFQMKGRPGERVVFTFASR